MYPNIPSSDVSALQAVRDVPVFVRDLRVACDVYLCAHRTKSENSNQFSGGCGQGEQDSYRLNPNCLYIWEKFFPQWCRVPVFTTCRLRTYFLTSPRGPCFTLRVFSARIPPNTSVQQPYPAFFFQVVLRNRSAESKGNTPPFANFGLELDCLG